jgi:hypothetical protein
MAKGHKKPHPWDKKLTDDEQTAAARGRFDERVVKPAFRKSRSLTKFNARRR